MPIRNFGAGTPRLNEGVIITGSPNNNESLSVTGSAIVVADVSNNYAAIIDNDAGSSGHGLKVTTDGTGTGTTILDLEAGSTTVFKVRGDGRVGIGVDTPGSTLSVDDEIAVGSSLIHRGDPDTLLSFSDNQIQLKAGNLSFIKLEKKGSAPHEITLNNGSNNIDFIVKGNGSNEGNPGMKFDGSTNKLGINGVGTPSYELDVDGDIGLSEYIYHNGDDNTYIRFQDDDINLQAGGRSMIKISEGSIDQVLIMSGGAATSPNVKTSTDTNFFVSGSVGSKGTSVAGTSVFGGDTVVSGALHVKGGHDFQGSTAAAIVLDSSTASKIVWDSEDDGNSPDASVYESGGSLYLSASSDVRLYAGTDDILLYPKDMLQVIEDEGASGNFASFFAQPTANTYYNVLDIGDSGVIINEDSRADYDLRVESDSNTHMLFVDAGNDKVGINASAPHSGLQVDTSFAFGFRTITQNHTATDTDHTIFVNAASTNIDVTLPTAANIGGRQYIIKRVDGAGTAVSIQTDGSETIDGASSAAMTDKRSVIIQSDNNNWWIVAEYISPP